MYHQGHLDSDGKYAYILFTLSKLNKFPSILKCFKVNSISLLAEMKVFMVEKKRGNL